MTYKVLAGEESRDLVEIWQVGELPTCEEEAYEASILDWWEIEIPSAQDLNTWAEGRTWELRSSWDPLCQRPALKELVAKKNELELGRKKIPTPE